MSKPQRCRKPRVRQNHEGQNDLENKHDFVPHHFVVPGFLNPTEREAYARRFGTLPTLKNRGVFRQNQSDFCNHGVYDPALIPGGARSIGQGFVPMGRFVEHDAVNTFVRGVQDANCQQVRLAGLDRFGHVQYEGRFTAFVLSHARPV